MDNADAMHRLRLALSYREKAREELGRPGGPIAVHREECKRHLSRAEMAILRYRGRLRESADAFASELQALRHQQKRLVDRVSHREIDPAQANAENRILAQSIAGLERAIDRLQEHTDAEDPSPFGGRIDMSLAGFAQEVGGGTTLMPRSSTRIRFTPFLVALGVMAMCIALYVGLLLSEPDPAPTFRARSLGKAGLPIEVVISNPGSRTLTLFVPWPDGRREEATDSTVGLLLYVRERDNASFQLLPYSESCWSVHGPVPKLSVLPGQSATVRLLPKALAALGIEARAVRITATTPSGEEIWSFEASLRSGSG